MHLLVFPQRHHRVGPEVTTLGLTTKLGPVDREFIIARSKIHISYNSQTCLSGKRDVRLSAGVWDWNTGSLGTGRAAPQCVAPRFMIGSYSDDNV